jgi:hypothetical protein
LDEETLDAPVGSLRVANKFPRWTAIAGRHTARVVLTLGDQRQEVSVPFEVRTDLPQTAPPRPSIFIPGRLSPSTSSQPMLVINSLDIHTVPAAPRPGDEVQISVNVQNRGGIEARGVEVEAFVDTRSLGKRTTNVGVSGRALPQALAPWTWTATQGTHTIRIVAKLGNAPPKEASRSVTVGAVMSPVRVVPQPLGAALNLVLANGIQLNPSSPKPGERVEIAVNVRNQGQGAAQNVKVEVFVDGPRLGEPTLLRSLAVGQTQTARFPWMATAGLHTIRAVASVGTYRQEAQKYIQVVALMMSRNLNLEPPELEVLSSDIRLTPSAPRPKSTVSIEVTVRNRGRGEVQGVKVECYVDRSKLGEFPVNAPVAAGRYAIVRGFQWTATAGEHTIKAVVTAAAQKQPVEAVKDVRVSADATHPTATIAVPPTIPPRGIPVTSVPDLRLAATDITYTPNPPKVGGTLTVAMTVHNDGKADAKGAQLTLALVKDDGSAVRVSPPPAFDVLMEKTYLHRFSMTVPDCKSLRLTAAVSHAGDKNPANNRAFMTINVQPSR